MSLPRLLIIGETGHGKDEACKILADHFGYRFESASMIACEAFVFELLKEKHGYSSIKECHKDRRNHIKEWVDIIAEYNETGHELAELVYSKSDIYNGVRKRDEFEAIVANCNVDCIIYVDASKRVPEQDESYVEVDKEDAHFVIDNNGSIEELVRQCKKANARAMQRWAANKPVESAEPTVVITRDNLAKARPDDKFLKEAIEKPKPKAKIAPKQKLVRSSTAEKMPRPKPEDESCSPENGTEDSSN